MKKAVVYARYSSERQNEQSITGQIEICQKFAQENDMNVIHVYVDEALTGRTDMRPDFQKMVEDAKRKTFDYVLVYKLDRFARNRFDSAIYKAQLKKCNVRVISAMEHISDSPEGIILESVLEGMAEYYSANLSQNVLRGMRQRAAQAKYMGGTVPLGYTIDKDKNYVINPDTACIVQTIYQMYADGDTLKDICAELNSKGYKSATGKPFTINALHSVLKNEKYIGVYKCMGYEYPDAVPRIIDNTLFDKVQERVQHNKQAPASAKSDVVFNLTGKLFCGNCGSNMVGDSGTSSTGAKYYYYTCAERKRGNDCKKKSVKKDWLEDLITDITVKRVLTDKNIDYIAKNTQKLWEQERKDDTELNVLKRNLAEVENKLENLMRAIENGIFTNTTKQRVLNAEKERELISAAIAKEEIEKPKLTEEQIKFFLYNMRDRIYNAADRREAVIKTFVNAVYLYDDKITITFNLKDGENLKKIELSEIEKFGFDTDRFTISLLFELYMFAITVSLDSDF